MKAGRLPSSGITRSLRYYSPLRLLTDLIRFSVALIPNHRGHHPQPARSPALPSKTSLTSRPDDPGESIDSSRLYLPMTPAFPIWQQGRHSQLQVTRLNIGSWLVRPVSLRSSVLSLFSSPFLLIRSFLDPLSPESRLSKPDLR